MVALSQKKKFKKNILSLCGYSSTRYSRGFPLTDSAEQNATSGFSLNDLLRQNAIIVTFYFCTLAFFRYSLSVIKIYNTRIACYRLSALTVNIRTQPLIFRYQAVLNCFDLHSFHRKNVSVFLVAFCSVPSCSYCRAACIAPGKQRC